MARKRDYKAEYQRRNELARKRGFPSYWKERNTPRMIRSERDFSGCRRRRGSGVPTRRA